MGDRANIVMTYGKGHSPIFLYTHWRGFELPKVLQNALIKRVRWNDPSYLTRIIFCELVKGQEGEPTGFGISPYLTDNDHDLLVVNTKEMIVERRSFPLKKSWSFEEYCGLDLTDEEGPLADF